MAPQSIHTVLASTLVPEDAGATALLVKFASWFAQWPRRIHCGGTWCAWRIAEARFRDFRAHRFMIDAEERKQAHANLDDVSAKSCGANSVDRSLYCSDDPTASAVCVHCSRARSPASGAL